MGHRQLELIIWVGHMDSLSNRTLIIPKTFVLKLLSFTTKTEDLDVYHNFPADGSQVSCFKRFNVLSRVHSQKRKESGQNQREI